MSPLYLKMVALGVAGVTVATAVPLSVLKSSDGVKVSQAQERLESTSSSHSNGEEILGHETDRSNHSGEGTNLGSPARTDTVEGSERGVDSNSVPSLPEDKVQVVSAQESQQIKDCKEIAKSYEGRLTICYNKQEDTKVTFNFISFLEDSQVDNTHHKVGKLSFFAPNNLRVEVLKIDNGGSEDRTILLDLYDEVFGVNGSLKLNSSSFTQDKCSVEWKNDGSTDKRVDWKAVC